MILFLILMVLVLMSIMMFIRFFPTATNVIVFILIVGGGFIYYGAHAQKSINAQATTSYKP